MNQAVIAVDIGGTKIIALLVGASGAVLAETRCATPAMQGAAAVLAAMEHCIDGLPLGGIEVRAIGISAAGVIDSEQGLVIDATDALPGWKGQNLARHFALRYRLPVACANDVHCALHGELWGDSALSALGGNVLMLTIGTGLGGALAHHGKVVAGRHFLAGHVGRTRVVHEGVEVPLESLVSGTGLARLYHARGGQGVGAAIMDAAARGETAATAALGEWSDHLALALHNLYWLIDPAAVILGGGMIDARAHWWPGLEARLAARGASLNLLPAALDNRAGAIGAARLAWEKCA